MATATAEAEAPAASISFRVSKVMDRAQMTGARKHDMRLGPQPGYVDGQRSTENTLLSLNAGYDLLKSAWTRHLDRDEAAMIARRIENRKAKAMWRAAIITFSTEAQALLGDKSPELEAKAAFEDFAQRHGVRLLWAVGHHDESAVHFHAMFENIRADGRCLRLNATQLSAEQDLAAGHFAHLGLVRGTRKAERIAAGESPSATINRSVKQLHADLPAEIEAVQEKLAKAQARADKAEAKAAKYEGDADQALSRLESYQGKIAVLEAKLAELTKIQGGLAAREAEAKAMYESGKSALREAAKDKAALSPIIEQIKARERVVAAREADITEFDELMKGNETPPQTEFREEVETEAYGMPYFSAMKANRGIELSWWQKVAHIVGFWRERLGLEASADNDYRP